MPSARRSRSRAEASADAGGNERRALPEIGSPHRAARDLPDVRGRRADEGDQRLPRLLAQEAHAEERREAGQRPQLLGVRDVALGRLVEPEVAADRLLARIPPENRDVERTVRRGDAPLAPADDPGPDPVFHPPAKRLAAREREREIEGTLDLESAADRRPGRRRHPRSLAVATPARQALRRGQER
jgi:hypothetical protein